MATRMTKKEKFMDIRKALTEAGLLTEERAEFIDHEVGLLTRKNSGENRKPTKAQVENEGHKANILTFLKAQETPVSATEIAEACELTSNQKAAALLKALGEAGLVVRTAEKGKALYSVA